MDKKQIIAEGKKAKQNDTICYYTYCTKWKSNKEHIESNFDFDNNMTDNRLIKLVENGTLIHDWDIYLVTSSL